MLPAGSTATASSSRSSSCRTPHTLGRCKQHTHTAVQPRLLASNCQQQRSSVVAAAAVGRRAALTGAAGLAAFGQQLPAWALRTIELRDGTQAEVYEHGMSLSIVALRGSLPEQWIVEFRQGLGRYAGFELGQRGQLQELFDELGNPGAKRSAGIADVVTLGDSWLTPAIQRRLIHPISSAETYRWWQRLPRRWQQLVRRDSKTGLPSESGEIWGCPYRWGAMLVAYKRDQLTRHNRSPIRCWPDLLQPALKGRIAFPDNPREFVGIALKTLGHPAIGFNATEADLAAAGCDREAVKSHITRLKSQARLFSSQEHVRALAAGDVWVTIGSSTDLVPLAERTPSVDLIAPADGTNLWADVWVVPANAEHGHLQSGPSPLLPSWLEFGISPARADVLMGFKSGASPILLPNAHVEHKPAALAAAAATAAAAGASEASSSSSSKKHKWQRGGQQQQRLQQEQQLLGRLQQLQQQQRQQQQMFESAAQLSLADLRLGQDNSFLPPEVVLQLSEFMLPVDSSTLDFYRWLLS
uniref:Uncharacterized protein n=1 Tax=Tetradesmus obliquus TaxID=3088 RepID=A0A383VEJ6_TETOB|eukprot:jgi/Sobl393_1/16776/SZX63937.1